MSTHALDNDDIDKTSNPDHDLDTAPLITRDAFDTGDFATRSTQYGVFGSIVSTQ